MKTLQLPVFGDTSLLAVSEEDTVVESVVESVDNRAERLLESGIESGSNHTAQHSKAGAGLVPRLLPLYLCTTGTAVKRRWWKTRRSESSLVNRAACRSSEDEERHCESRGARRCRARGAPGRRFGHRF